METFYPQNITRHYLKCIYDGCDYEHPEYGIDNNRTNCKEHKTDEMFNAEMFMEISDE